MESSMFLPPCSPPHQASIVSSLMARHNCGNHFLFLKFPLYVEKVEFGLDRAGGLCLATTRKQAQWTHAPELRAKLPTSGIVRAKTIASKKLLLSSKLSVNNCYKAQTRCNIRRFSRDVRGQKMTCRMEFLLTAPIPRRRRRRHDNGLPTTPQSHGWLSHPPTDMAVGASKITMSRVIVGILTKLCVSTELWCYCWRDRRIIKRYSRARVGLVPVLLPSSSSRYNIVSCDLGLSEPARLEITKAIIEITAVHSEGFMAIDASVMRTPTAVQKQSPFQR
ncbi:hypothetical protein Acr_01g0009790 [Actinidia rufa]|uniref:Uncharacterized protein n=1 Tax=Actinidia rufa TaxID=165716 RepID=A0A7J0E428_9ERIC|nr:hypothetical protein Acr_01g0009790 [Actinidia rufa]